MRLVEDVDLEPPLDRLQDDALPDLADVVDPALRRCVHLDHVERGAVRDPDTGVARLVGIGAWAARAGAVERLREDARQRGLPRAAWAREEARLPYLVVLEGAWQRPH